MQRRALGSQKQNYCVDIFTSSRKRGTGERANCMNAHTHTHIFILLPFSLTFTYSCNCIVHTKTSKCPWWSVITSISAAVAHSISLPISHRIVFYRLDFVFLCFCQNCAVICKSGILATLVWLICTVFFSYLFSTFRHWPSPAIWRDRCFMCVVLSDATFFSVNKKHKNEWRKRIENFIIFHPSL